MVALRFEKPLVSQRVMVCLFSALNITYVCPINAILAFWVVGVTVGLVIALKKAPPMSMSFNSAARLL